MPGPRRNINRLQNPSGVPSFPKTKLEHSGTSTSGSTDDGNPLANLILQPKHAYIPEIMPDHNVIFEGMVFLFSVSGLCLQYINLYKTVWWLPHSSAQYALNFYLIDPYLSMLLVVIMSRRVVYSLITDIQGPKSRRNCCYWLSQLFKVILVLCVLAGFIFASYHVVLKHSFLYSLFLCYPLVTYIILFGPNIKPLFGKNILVATQPTPAANTEKGTPKHKPRDGSVSRDMPSHHCSMSPEAIREEVEVLKTDFNNRIKQVLFNSMLCAYYMGFVPLCFAQNTLYYDTWWVGQHVCLVWICAFVMFMVHFLPARYVDVLHRCALHLGKWTKVEGRHAHVPYNAWSELQVWQQGALVKHVKGLFKAEGLNNSAEPGNGSHSRFYFMFHQPLRVTNWLLVLTWGLVLYEFFLLAQSIEWSHILSLAFLLFTNYYILFKLMRDRIVLTKAYKDEHKSMDS